MKTKIITLAITAVVFSTFSLVAAVNPYQPGLNIKTPTITANNFAVTTLTGVADGLPRATNGIANAATGILTNVYVQPAQGKGLAVWVGHRGVLAANMAGQTNIVLKIDHGPSTSIMTSNQPLSITMTMAFDQTNHLVYSYGFLDRTNFPNSDWLRVNHLTVSGASQNITNMTFGWPR